MFKRMTLLRSRPDLSPAKFQVHWKAIHGALVMKLPGIKRYVQNDILNSWPPIVFNGIVELWFPDEAALRHAFQSPAGRQLPEDEANFIGGKIVCDVEERVLVPNTSRPSRKLISVVSYPDHENVDVWEKWCAAMQAAVKKYATDIVGLSTHRISTMQYVGSEKDTKPDLFGFVVYQINDESDLADFANSANLDELERVPGAAKSTSKRIAVSPRELCNRL
jgi:uncharacterized protein (TIGR02118 family)